MKKFMAVFQMALSDGLVYRGDVLLFVLSGIAQPLVILVVWLAVTASGGHAPLSQMQLIQYYLYVMLFAMITSAWGAPFISRDIRTGQFSAYLLKPVSYIFYRLGDNLGEKVVKSLYLLPLFLALNLFFRLPIPAVSILSWIVFFLSLTSAVFMALILDISLGLVAFWLEESRAFEEIYGAFETFFSGRLVPLVALPLFFQRLSPILPFRYLLSFTIETLLTPLGAKDLFIGLLFQAVWLAATILLYRLLWINGIKKYSAAGA